MRRFCCLMLLICLLPLSACALIWPSDQTRNITLLQSYIEQVNEALDKVGGTRINSVFECYDTFATLGVTLMSDSDSPEKTEIVVSMGQMGLDHLEISTSDINGFAELCAALTAVAAREGDQVKKYLGDPSAYVSRVKKNPLTSFSDTVHYEKGSSVRVYFAYEPNEYGDGQNYLSMTLVFPRELDALAGIDVTPVPTTATQAVFDGSDDAGDYVPYDEGTHLEVFVTPTPEPDSAAGEMFH